MIAWTLSDHSLAAAAAARKNSLGLRAAHNAAFALGVGLTTGSIAQPLIWYPIIVALMIADVWAGQEFLAAEGARKRLFKAVFVTSSVAMIAVFMGMALSAAAYGGEEGRLAAVFMAAGSFVTVMVLMVEAPMFMLLSALPGALALALLPILPGAPSKASDLAATLGLYVTLATFTSHLARTAIQHVTLFRSLKGARDEAEQRRMEADAGRVEAEVLRREAEQANRVKSEFLCTMTHELRTPLNAVINYSEMIAEETGGMVSQDASRITRSAHHLLQLIERILDFSEIDAGRLRLFPETFPVEDTLREVVAEHRADIESHGNSVVLSAEGLSFHADRARFKQCISCLVSNAARFTRNGQISVTAFMRGDVVCVSVRDSGVGMEAGQLERVFEPFAQSDGSKTRAADGLGLGLASARKIARAMGGDIVAFSVPGQGSAFELRAPAALPQRADEAVAA